ncbi:hypothetical protein C9J12_21215 [Photobacterium frigidiphilum]|uniref:Peptidase S1 domain-containing protein n=1 Tax=Photobacterium frigidiphilum TaxID=264736 RepID=A0A2T3JAD8_9GAMM|nr:trypsin-like serine protease [Photobacterium frigidiphilum]PSU45808.1 hypothetical protein C9J12_21215 [Photobacterium frigidiphilum]
MKRIIGLIAMCLLTANASAVENGLSEYEESYPQLVRAVADRGSCTSTIVGGSWVITAAHCSSTESVQGSITTWDNQQIISKRIKINPDNIINGFDIALWKLQSPPSINKISFLSLDTITANDLITIYGYSTGLLNSGSQKAQAIDPSIPQVINMENIGQGTNAGGDSGMPYMNSNETIVAIHSGSTGVDDNGFGRGATGSRITHSKDFILDTINAWHYPTSVKTINGTATISVQSLHRGDVIDTSYSDGDVSLDLIASTCDDASIPEFGICTYVINSNGGEGKLYLTPTESITVNRAPEPTKPDPKPDNGGSGGGSFGFLSLMGLLGLAWRRKA